MEESSLGPTGDLIPLGLGYKLGENNIWVDAPITIGLPLPAGDAGRRVQFYYSGNDGLERVDTARANGRASATVKQLGVYQLFDDATPPTLEFPQMGDNQTATSFRPTIRARAIDKGSGIDTFRTTYNGKWLLVEYDPEQDLLAWEQDEDLPAGRGILAVEVRDHAGNVSRRETTVLIEASAR